jgi:anaerobic ribonucleoside-triphosphate reductase activating protein
MDVSNGEGIGVALFVQGCHFHCRNCFNPETWDFSGGQAWTQEMREKLIFLAGRNFIKRVSFLGGEPMAVENCLEIISVMAELKEKYPQKQIWLYSGYEWDYLIENRRGVVDFVDVAVLGRYVDELKDVGNRITKWAGSTNQIVIDVQKSLSEHRIVLYKTKN